MKYDKLLDAFATHPFFETEDLLTLFEQDEQQTLPRLSRWVKQGKLVQLRRGKYLLPVRYQKYPAHLFYISNYLYGPSYVSLFSALAHYGIIPEHAPMVQAITTRKTRQWETHLGQFHYHCLKAERFFGYERVQLGSSPQQQAFLASPEKALIDICLLNGGKWYRDRWAGLRLQHLELLNTELLRQYSSTIPGPRLNQGTEALIQFIEEST